MDTKKLKKATVGIMLISNTLIGGHLYSSYSSNEDAKQYALDKGNFETKTITFSSDNKKEEISYTTNKENTKELYLDEYNLQNINHENDELYNYEIFRYSFDDVNYDKYLELKDCINNNDECHLGASEKIKIGNATLYKEEAKITNPKITYMTSEYYNPYELKGRILYAYGTIILSINAAGLASLACLNYVDKSNKKLIKK